MAGTFALVRSGFKPLLMSAYTSIYVPNFSRAMIDNLAVTSSIQIRTATKKAGGSSNNGRDSAGRRLGVKIFPNRSAKAGSIIVRQRGRKFYAGENVGMGKDHTLFSKIDGIVRFTKHEFKSKKNIVSVEAA